MNEDIREPTLRPEQADAKGRTTTFTLRPPQKKKRLRQHDIGISKHSCHASDGQSGKILPAGGVGLSTRLAHIFQILAHDIKTFPSCTRHRLYTPQK